MYFIYTSLNLKLLKLPILKLIAYQLTFITFPPATMDTSQNRLFCLRMLRLCNNFCGKYRFEYVLSKVELSLLFSSKCDGEGLFDVVFIDAD